MNRFFFRPKRNLKVEKDLKSKTLVIKNSNIDANIFRKKITRKIMHGRHNIKFGI